MKQYVTRRLLLIPPTLLILSFILFGLIHAAPGNVLVFLYKDADVTEEEIAGEMQRLGLDKSVLEQYVYWLRSVSTGDLGRSLFTGRPVWEDLAKRWPVTFELAVLAIFFGTVFGISTGILSGAKQDSIADYVLRSVGIAGLSLPAFWLATMLLIGLAVWFKYSPPMVWKSPFEDPWMNLQQMIFPSLIQGFSLSAVTMRITRSSMLDVLRQDYIRTARSKGLKETVLLLRHGLRNALIPVFAMLGVQVAVLMGGLVLQETVFNLPGIGSYVVDVALRRDYPAFEGVLIVLGIIVMAMNLIVDVLLGYIDPRIRHGMG